MTSSSPDAFPYIRLQDDGTWHLLVRVQPGARRSEITGERDGRLAVRLCAPAVENKANTALVAFIAETLGIRRSRVRLAAGATAREKRLVLSPDDEPDWSKLMS